MIDTVIIDDEQDAQITLMNFLQMHCKDKVNIVGTSHSVKDGYQLLTSRKIDLLFLDIKMNDGTGFDLLEKLGQFDFNVIFTTAYDEYALKAFKYSAIDYLLKPIDPLELTEAVDRVQEESEQDPRKIDSLIQMYKKEQFDKIAIPSMKEFHFVGIQEIIRCEASSNYTIIYLSSGRKIVAPKTLKEFEELLSADGFFRVHQSHLIHLRHINQFYKSKNKILLNDGSEVEVSRRKKTLFMELINMKKL